MTDESSLHAYAIYSPHLRPPDPSPFAILGFKPRQFYSFSCKQGVSSNRRNGFAKPMLRGTGARVAALVLALLAACVVGVSGDNTAVFVCGGEEGAPEDGVPQQRIPRARYNDDFCDCDDGRSERGRERGGEGKGGRD